MDLLDQKNGKDHPGRRRKSDDVITFKFAALYAARVDAVSARADKSRCFDGFAFVLGRICVVTQPGCP